MPVQTRARSGMDWQVQQHIEALIFAAEQPITALEIKVTLEDALEQHFDEEAVEAAVQAIRAKYADEQFAFEVVGLGAGYQFLTKPAHEAVIGTLLKQKNKKRLSKSALETLSIVAYKQPLTKGEVEQIRGVNCDYAIQKLLEKELIAVSGRSDAAGKPLLYVTTPRFLNHFGIKSTNELPKLKDFQQQANEIGSPEDQA